MLWLRCTVSGVDRDLSLEDHLIGVPEVRTSPQLMCYTIILDWLLTVDVVLELVFDAKGRR